VDAVTVILDADEAEPAARAEVIRELIWSRVVRVEIRHHPVAEQIRALGKITDLGRLTICSIESNATTVRRTPKQAHDDLEPSLFLGLQVSGTSMVIQGDRQAVLHPGDLALYDTTAPYTLLNDDGIHQHFFRIPIEDLALPATAISQVTALRLSPDRPVADLAATYFSRLAIDPHVYGMAGAESIGHPSIELVRALVTAQLSDPGLAREPLRATLQLQIIEYLRAHLGEHDLTAARIAANHHISVRHLYSVLAASGISLGDWVRDHRLEECRRELARPRARAATIASIAHRWGFGDATHFGRAFREAYGMSPREWRELHNHSPQAQTQPR
jgi:AraC-like DNA-binding protein